MTACSVSLPRGAVDWYEVCDCGIYWSIMCSIVFRKLKNITKQLGGLYITQQANSVGAPSVRQRNAIWPALRDLLGNWMFLDRF